ncbi:guanylate-binding protein 4-like [Actinia tenebrosa]|uniref:Guanylate-binding protein 4-like n=1 Tax=Actinia tenebrosa TaxID=6105 RepID=A0A6P8JBE5_ACTTE|nr:guanylate-binding protein 4-like [Actinia tenebrosa]
MSKVAIPLVLPNNCTWDAQTGTYDKKKGVGRETLNAIPKALDQLREIKGPVCVVSIAGPCRKGKSYILGKVFDQEEIFPLGHLLDPETMGIWLWIVPQKFQDSTGRDFTVILLDSEGIDSVYAKQADDHRIFTLSVLLSSILIYNSAGVPNRSDLEGLDFIAQLSQRIQLYTKKKNATYKDESHFYEAFPNFIWLLRDVVLEIPAGCSNIKEYFLKKVLNAEGEAGSSRRALKAADSILNFFSDFDAFSLPPPSYRPQVVQNLNDKSLESQVNSKFLEGIKGFKAMLHPKLAPMKSINEGEFVTGEALAALAQLFVEALNTPGTVPNVENAWDTFVHNKCTEVLAAALAAYKQEMTSQMKDKIPCEAEAIRESHENAVDVGLVTFRRETFDLSTKHVDEYLTEFRNKTKTILEDWIQENRRHTQVYCSNLLKKLKEQILNPVLAQLCGSGAAKMEFKDLVEAYDKIEERYKMDGRGAKDVQANILMKFIPELRDEMQQHAEVLKRMKDYDEEIEREKTNKIVAEEQQRRFEELMAELEEERQNMEKQVELLREKQKEEIVRIQQIAMKNAKERQEQMDNMLQANFQQRIKDRQEAIRQQKKLEETLEELKESLKNRRVEIIEIDRRIEEHSKPGMMDILAPIATFAISRLLTRFVPASCSIM